MDQFVQFGWGHWLGILLTYCAAGVGLSSRDWPAAKKNLFAKVFGVSVIVFYLLLRYLVVWADLQWDVRYHLPLHISNFILLWFGLSFLLPGKIWYLLAMLWGIPSALISPWFPDLNHGINTAYYWAFWISHGFLLFAAFLLAAYREYELNYTDVWKGVFSFGLYILTISKINQIIGSNYGYLSSPPPFLPIAWSGDNPGYLLLFFLIMVAWCHLAFAVHQKLIISKPVSELA